MYGYGRLLVLAVEMGGIASVLRAVIALTLVGGATTAVVAPAFDMAAARSAQRAAGQARAPLASNTPTPDPTTRPDPTYPPRVDYGVLLRACLESGDPDSEACMNAQSESGLSPADFRAKIVAKLARPSPEPTAQPDLAATFESCLATRDINSDACHRAFELSGLAPKDFEEKFYAKLEAKDRAAKATPKVEGDFWTWFDKCLATRDAHSDPCVKAQALIGFNDADFQAKFARYLAERDAKSAKPTPKPTATAKATPVPVPTVWSAYVDLLVKECLTKQLSALAAPGSTQAVIAAGEACQKAIIATGLSPRDFWARFPVPQPAKN